MNAITPIQASLPNAPLVDRAGNLTPAWRSWFLAIMARTGGTIGTDASGAATAAQLAAEVAARAAADTTLTGAISTEAATRATADTAEAATRAAADAYLGGQSVAATTGSMALETAPAGFGTKISAMPAAGTVTGAELFPIVQAGGNATWTMNTLYQTILQLAEFIPNPLDAAPGSDLSGEFIEFFAGNGDQTGLGGTIAMQAGNGGATSGDGGNVQFIAGQGGATSGAGGTANFQAGHAPAIGNGGPLEFVSGNGGVTSGDGGPITFSAGGAGDGNGGDMTFNAGPGAGANNGGLITFNAGNSGNGATGAAGGMTFVAGTCNATDGDGGDVTLQTGNGAGTGRAGVYVLNNLGTTDAAIPFSLWSDNGVLVQSGFTVTDALHTPDVIGDVSLPIGLTTGTTDTSASGTISATTGDGSTGANSGDVLLTTGAGQDTGRVQLTTGTATGTSGNINCVTGDGDSSGTINFAAGTAIGGGGVGGSVLFQAGAGATPGDLQFVVNGGNVLTNNSWPTSAPAVSGALWIDPVTYIVMAAP